MFADKIVHLVPEKGSPKGSPKTTDRILELIQQDSGISTVRIGEALGISKRAVIKHTNKLQEAGKLRHVGSSRGGHWEIIGGGVT